MAFDSVMRIYGKNIAPLKINLKNYSQNSLFARIV